MLFIHMHVFSLMQTLHIHMAAQLIDQLQAYLVCGSGEEPTALEQEFTPAVLERA